jgi:hypothetical protein
MTLRLRMVVCAFLLWSATARPQSLPQVIIDPVGANGRVDLSPLTADAQLKFAKLFEIPLYQEYRPFTLLLTNRSPQDIVALRIRWIAKSAGKIGVFTSGTDSLELSSIGSGGSRASWAATDPTSGVQRLGASHSASQGIVAAPGERVLIAPGLFVRESEPRAGGAASYPEAFRSADTITASVEAVVLEDGEVTGANPQSLIDWLTASKAAVEDVVKRVRDAEQRGEDGTAELRTIAQEQPNREHFSQSMEAKALARRLMLSREWKKQLEKLAAKQLPNFHR